MIRQKQQWHMFVAWCSGQQQQRFIMVIDHHWQQEQQATQRHYNRNNNTDITDGHRSCVEKNPIVRIIYMLADDKRPQDHKVGYLYRWYSSTGSIIATILGWTYNKAKVSASNLRVEMVVKTQVDGSINETKLAGTIFF